MKTYLKYRPAWLQFLIFGSLTVGIFIALGLVTVVCISFIYGIPMSEMGDMSQATTPKALEAAKVFQAFSSIGMFAVPSLVFAYLADHKSMRFLGFRKPEPMIMLALSVVLLLVALPAVARIGHMNQQMHLPASMANVEKWMRDAEALNETVMRRFLVMNNVGDLIKMIIIIAVIPAFAEELFFRGVLQRIFTQAFTRPWAGIIISAVIFSAIHVQFLGFFPRVFLGILLGAMYWYSGSLWPGIIVHFINNAMQVIIIYNNPKFIDNDMTFPIGLVLLSLFATVAVLVLMSKLSHTRYAEVYDVDDDDELPFRPLS